MEAQGEPKLHFGNYRGEVVRNNDPKESGRIKINVFGVYDGLPIDVLPWATYADPNMGGISEVGSAIVPEIGAHVWVFFEGGDHHFPVYWAGAPAIENETSDLPKESRQEESEYPKNKVRKTASGILIEMDDTPDNVRYRFYHPSDTETEIDNEGNQTELVVKDHVTHVLEERIETVEGDVNEDYNSNHSTTVELNRSETVEGDVNEDYNSNHSTTVTGNRNENVSGNVTENYFGNQETNAATVTINSDGTIDITAVGIVNVTGAIINLN